MHALKSSAKLIGATDIADRAQLLENAGKERDIPFIRDKHDSFMKDYLRYKDLLKDAAGKENAGEEGIREDKPTADKALMDCVYDGLKGAAEAMDIDGMEEILKELSEYSIPDDEKAKFEAVCDKMNIYDYEGIVRILSD